MVGRGGGEGGEGGESFLRSFFVRGMRSFFVIIVLRRMRA